METPKIRVMLADDDAGLLAAIADSVRSAADLEIVATAQDANEVTQRAQASRPDVIVMDVSMPGGGGAAAAREVARTLPDTKVVALSAHEDTASALRMLEAGAVAYVVKGAPEPEILDAIRRAHRGQMSLPAELGSSTVKELARELQERQQLESVLRKGEQRGTAILESVPDAMVIVGASGAIELVNTQTEKLFGYQRGELIGQPVVVLVPDRFRPIHETQRAKVSQRYARPLDAGPHFLGRRKDGTEFPVDISLSPLETEDGGKAVATIRDITRRAIADDAQRKSEQLFRGILDSAPDAMVVVDTNGTIQVVNAQTERLFGYTRAELRGKSVDILLPERYQSAHARHRAGYTSKPQARPMGAALEPHGRRKDGTEFPVDVSLSPMQSESGTLVIAAVRNITDRREARRKLDESFETVQRQRLFARLIAAQEEERLRIASDIHDDTIQAMTATSLRMQQMRRHLTDPGQIALLSRLEDAVRESITRLRRLMFDLRPASLDRSGLAWALRELLARVQEETHLTFTLENHLNSEPAGEIRTALYRIAQEALANVKKHAAASTVNVELRSVGAGCRVRIQDDGSGFEVEGTESRPGNLRLVSMRERAQIAGGWWLVRCPPEGGTVVEFWLPFEAEASPLNGEPVGGQV